MKATYQDDTCALYNLDCRDVLPHLSNIDMILTDPPYKISSRGSSGGTGGMLNTDLSRAGNIFAHNELSIDDFISQIYDVVRDDAHCYLFTNNKNLKDYLNKIDEKFNIYKTLIWNKNTSITNMYYMDKHEYIVFFRKSIAKKINDCGTASVLNYNNPRNKFHPTEKPVDLLVKLIENSTNEGDTVLDFTMGSGSTGVACRRTNRKFIGIEKDSVYFDIALKRITEKVAHKSLESLF